MEKDLNIEALRGLAILGVVLIHSTSYSNLFFPVQFLDIFSKFGVPLFIFISGYFVYKQKDKIENNFGDYLKKRFIKIGPPYLFMTVLLTLISFCNHFNILRFIKSLFFNFFLGTACVPYYFIIVIFQMYLLSKLVLWLYKKSPEVTLILAAALTLLYSGLFYWQVFFTQARATIIPYYMWQFPNYILWFVLGIEFAAQNKAFGFLNAIKNKYYYILFIVSLLVCCLETHYLLKIRHDDGAYIALSSILWEFVAIIFFWKFKDKFNNKLFVTFGIYSFGIFLIHKPIFDLLFKILGSYRHNVFGVFYAVIVIVLSILVINCANFIKNKFYSLDKDLVYEKNQPDNKAV